MSRKNKKWIQIKIIAGMAALLLGSTAVITYLNLLAEDNHANQKLLGEVKQLHIMGKAIKRRGTTYANHAPRDYGPYNRDVIIFYPDFMRDLTIFEQQTTHIAKIATRLPRGLLHATGQPLNRSINNLQEKWQTFKQGFQEKLGNNPAEPRLEWGADYVQANQDLINSITGMLIMSIENAIQKQLNSNKQLSLIAISVAGALLLLGIFWFYFSVVRRISLTIDGCQRVAQGDFGYQLLTHSKDELGSLANAFNTLSARTRFVLNMLSKMHRHDSSENKIDSLMKEASGYLPIQWLGLWQVNPNDNSLILMSMRSERPLRSNMQKLLSDAAGNDAHLLELVKKQGPVKYDNLSEIASKLPNARLIREIIKIGLLNSALIVPLRSDDGWQGLLVFIASDQAAYTNEQVKLMGNLSKFIANGFAQAKK